MSSPLIWGGNGSQLLQQGGINLTNGQVLAFSGPKNYLTNPLAETGTTTGWSLGTVTLTSNLPTGTPTFGSGASGNLTLSATSTTPLSGSYSFSYASSAATTAGNFIASDAFTVDSADLGKVLTVQFYYKATSNPSNANWSGTTSNSFSIAIYDVTAGGANWIIPVGNQSMIQSTNTGIANASFQTSVVAGQQYRIVVYNANATSNAITLYFDQFFTGPQSAGFVSAISDWSQNNTGFVPSAGFGTVSSASYYYRQVGDSAQVTMTWLNGTVAGSTASVALPFVIDSSKLPSNASGTWVGVGSRMVTVASRSLFSNNDAFVVFYDGSTTNTVYVTGNEGASAYTKSNGSAISSTSDAISITFTVPVVGWSSGMTVTGSVGGVNGVVAAELNTASSTTVTANTAISFTTTGFDTAGAVSSLNKFTAPVTGTYLVSYYNDATTSAGTRPYVAKNSSFTATNSNILTSSGSVTAAGGAILIQLNAGDFIQIAYNTSCTLVSTSVNWNICLIQGSPAVARSSNSVNARYFASSTSISGSLATVSWTTKDFDSANAMSAGTYTIPITGKYQVNSGLVIAGTFALNGTADLQIQKNGTVVSEDSAIAGGAQTSMNVNCSDIINCIAGDTIRVQVSTSASGPSISASNSKNFFSIASVGN